MRWIAVAKMCHHTDIFQYPYNATTSLDMEYAWYIWKLDINTTPHGSKWSFIVCPMTIHTIFQKNLRLLTWNPIELQTNEVRDCDVCAPVRVMASYQGAVSIRKTVLPGMAIPMLKIRRPNGRLIFNMEIAIRR